MDNYYVYEWIRLDSNEPFYVGKGAGNRWKHLTRDGNSHINNIVSSIPVAVNILHDNLEEQIAFEYEVYYIWLYRDIIGYPLCNNTDGGEGYSCRGNANHKSQKVICLNNRVIYESIHIAQEHFGNIDIYACCKGLNKYAGTIDNARLVWKYYDVYLKMSNEDIEKALEDAQHSKCGCNNSFYGKTHSEQTLEKLRKASKEKYPNESTRQKLSASRQGSKNPMYGKRGKDNPNYGIKRSQETVDKLKAINGISVKCIELNKVFISLHDAEVYMKKLIPKFNRKSLKKCLDGLSKNPYYGELIIENKKIQLHWEYMN